MYKHSSRSKHKKRSGQPEREEPWSPWQWSDERGEYYRARRNAQGDYEYEFHPGGDVDAEAQAEAQEETPRLAQEPTVEDITDDLQGYQISEDQDTLVGSSSSSQHSSRSHHAKSSRSGYRSKGKGKQVAQGYGEELPDSYGEPYDPQDPYGEAYKPSFAQGGEEDDQGDGASTPRGRQSFDEPPPQFASDDDDPEFRRALDQSRRTGQGQGSIPGESAASSSSAYVAYDDTFDPAGAAQDIAGTSPLADENIPGTAGASEILDPRYIVEPSYKFRAGEVFKVLWSEPKGSATQEMMSDRKLNYNEIGEQFYVGFRRFIVIAQDEGHSTCVPILTYGGKACKKKGVKAQKHGVIHALGHRAHVLKDEPKLGFASARMRITAEGEKLARESRANYSKLVTVEHNVKVFFIGHIIPEDFEIVSDAVNKCWEDKVHHQRKMMFSGR